MSLLEKEKDLFFVEVKDPRSSEKKLLEAQKAVVESLQKYETVKMLRAKKLKSINKLKTTIKELLKLFSDLKSSLPKTKITESLPKRTKIVEIRSEDGKIKRVDKITKRPRSELEKLEAELGAIEEKLGSLK
ncbi:hypothetical protein ISS05_03935 [Candidatus Woesearchaeota archaeon]|nr:hypothetical protein [Candidatus Woesearchaeota archaeon]